MRKIWVTLQFTSLQIWRDEYPRYDAADFNRLQSTEMMVMNTLYNSVFYNFYRTAYNTGSMNWMRAGVWTTAGNCTYFFLSLLWLHRMTSHSSNFCRFKACTSCSLFIEHNVLFTKFVIIITNRTLWDSEPEFSMDDARSVFHQQKKAIALEHLFKKISFLKKFGLRTLELYYFYGPEKK